MGLMWLRLKSVNFGKRKGLDCRGFDRTNWMFGYSVLQDKASVVTVAPRLLDFGFVGLYFWVFLCHLWEDTVLIAAMSLKWVALDFPFGGITLTLGIEMVISCLFWS